MPGSAQNIADANIMLNTAVAKELKQFADELEGARTSTALPPPGSRRQRL